MAYITLSKQNFFSNLDSITAHIGSIDKLALVLKDNAYGHGILEMAALAEEYGITKAVVRCIPEAKMIDKYFEYILVLADIPSVADEHVYTINSLEEITRFPKESRVELKVDTGMHRNGVMVDEIDEAIATCKKQGLKLEAIFTHFRSADELSSEWFFQKKQFDSIKETYKDLGLRFHSANSAGVFRSSTCNEDMVRVGIGAYGCLEMLESFHTPTLKPVLSLYADKISTKQLLKSNAIGYGATFTCKENSTVSTYDVGYADGVFRILSNNYTSPNGSKLLGRVSMDNCSFEGEEKSLLIFDDARVIAKHAMTLSYEVLTSLKFYIRREVV